VHRHESVQEAGGVRRKGDNPLDDLSSTNGMSQSSI